MTPRQLASVYALLCTVSMVIAILFATRGAWMVLGFAIVEMSAVACAFLIYARHAIDRETIRIHGRQLVVEWVNGSRTSEHVLDLYQVRVRLPDNASELIELQCGKRKVEVGRHLPAWRRRQFALELGERLRAVRAM